MSDSVRLLEEARVNEILRTLNGCSDPERCNKHGWRECDNCETVREGVEDVVAELQRLREALEREDDPDESRCSFCHRVTRPWLTDDATWALVEPLLGQGQACLVCFYDALSKVGATNGEPLRVALAGSTAAQQEETNGLG